MRVAPVRSARGVRLSWRPGPGPASTRRPTAWRRPRAAPCRPSRAGPSPRRRATSTSTSISRQLIGSLSVSPNRMAVTRSSATSTRASPAGPASVTTVRSVSRMATGRRCSPAVISSTRAVSRAGALPVSPSSSGACSSCLVSLPAGSLRCQPSSSPPTRRRSVTLCWMRSQVLGVEVGGAQVDPSGIRCPPAAEFGQAAQLRQDEVGIGVVFLLGFQVVALAARHASKATSGRPRSGWRAAR